MDCYGTYFTHAQTCDNLPVPSATEWTATVHTLHMPKPVITFLFQVLRNGLLRCILYTWIDVLSANTCLKLKMRRFLPALLLRVAKNHCFTTTRASFGVSTTLKKCCGFAKFLQERLKLYVVVKHCFVATLTSSAHINHTILQMSQWKTQHLHA